MHEFTAQQIDQNECPVCFSTEIKHPESAFCTAVGWFGGPDKDPNHWTLGCECEGCGQKYHKHWIIASKAVWTVDPERRVLRGEVGCCRSSYLRPCTSCEGGWVAHSTFLKSTGWRGDVPMQPMYWKCQDCEEVFPDDNWGTKYMTEEDLKKAREEIMLAGPQEPKPLLGLSVYELPGIGVSNTKALTRLTISKD